MKDVFKEITLGEVLDFQNGKSIKPGGQGLYPVYGSNGLIGKSDHYTHANAIIIGRVGAYCGSVKYCSEHFWASDNTIVASVKNDSDIKYFYYLLEHLNLNIYAGGSAQPLLTQTVLKQLNVKVPGSSTQRKIAAVLSAYDGLIENNARRIALLEEMARRLYREWFVRFRFPGHQAARRVDSPLGMIPEGWEVQQMGEVCHILMGQSPESRFYNETGDGLPFHQGVKDFGDLFPTTRVYCTITERVAEKGDILFSVRAPVGRINIADRKIVIGRGLSAIRSKTENQAFTFVQLKERFHEEDMIGGGTIFKAVTRADMHGILLLMPPAAAIAEFEQIVNPILAELKNLTARNVVLRRTRDLLLPRLVSGALDVAGLEIAVGD